MTSDLSKIVDLLSVDDISTIRDGGEHAPIDPIDNETTRIVLSPPVVSCQKIHPSPVCRLPPELLSSIFLQYTRQWHCEYKSTFSAEIPRWVHVSYVCQYWRNVALNYSDLWAHLFFVSSRWMMALLQRSKTAPLIVHANVSCLHRERTIELLKKAFNQMGRIQDLWIRFPCTDVVPQNQFEVHEDSFAGVMPDLRKVHLEFCQVHWSSPIFNDTLTELDLCRLTNHSEMDFHGLLLTLRRLSSLRRLYLDRVLPDTAMANTRNMQLVPVKATLPRLEKLTLIDSVSRVPSLLDHLEFPQSTVARVECTCLVTQDLVAFQSFIKDRFGDHQSLPLSPVSYQPGFLRCLDICRSGQWRDWWKVTCGTSNHTDTCGPNVHLLEGEGQDSQFPLKIEFMPMYYGGRMALQGIVPFLLALPVAHLNMITLQGDYSLYHDQCLWTDVFKDAQELRVIRLQSSEANPLIAALQPRNGATFAYALTDIEFKRVKFKRVVQTRCGSNGSHNRGESGCFHCLHDTLVSRAAAGYVIQRLCFDHCTRITEEDVMKLLELVGKVELTTRKVECAVLCLSSRY